MMHNTYPKLFVRRLSRKIESNFALELEKRRLIDIQIITFVYISITTNVNFRFLISEIGFTKFTVAWSRKIVFLYTDCLTENPMAVSFWTQ